MKIIIYIFINLQLTLMVNGQPGFSREYDPDYKENFDRGYFPFNDFSEPDNETRSMLDRREYCNRVFSEYLEQERSTLKLTPPDYPMKIAILFVVTNIYEISEKDQSVTLTTFIEISWRDRRLADIGGNKCANVTKVLPNLDRIFFPVFTIENSVERVLYEETWEKFPAVIYSSGVVVWITSLRLVLNCKMNMKIFPFDSQNCFILIRSPHYFLSELQYYVYSPDAALLLWNENVSNPLWQLTGQMPRLMASNISGIEIWFKLQRKPSFYVWTLVIPTAIISLATCLTFTLPHDSGEKMQTMLTGILAYFLLLLTMNEVTPQASDNFPVLTLFYVIVIGIGMFGAVVCAIIVRMHNAHVAKTTMDDDDDGDEQKSAKKTKQKLKQKSGREAAAILNDIFLVVYVLMLICCYAGLFFYIDIVKREINETIHSDFKYTPVSVFN